MKKILHFFIPSSKNNYRARILHIDFLFLFLAMAILLTNTFKSPEATIAATNVLGIATDITIDKLLDFTNQKRVENGLTKLTMNDKLSLAAEEKAKDMFVNNYWAHYSPKGKSPWDFMIASGYKYEFAGENLARDFMFSGDVVQAWMESPTHKENLLNKNYTEIGFATVNGKLEGKDTTLVVQMFGKPQKQTATVQKQENPPLTQKYVVIPQKVLSSETSTAALSFKNLSFDVSILLFGLLALVLIVDMYYAYKLKVVRVGGKNIAHLIFIAFIIISILSITKGFVI